MKKPRPKAKVEEPNPHTSGSVETGRKSASEVNQDSDTVKAVKRLEELGATMRFIDKEVYQYQALITAYRHKQNSIRAEIENLQELIRPLLGGGVLCCGSPG